MPLLLRLGVHVPVILVSSKQDLAEQEDEELAAVYSSLLCPLIFHMRLEESRVLLQQRQSKKPEGMLYNILKRNAI